MMYEERIAEFVMAFSSGRERETIDWLKNLGCVATSENPEGGEYILQGIAGVTSALVRGNDPSTHAVCMGFLLAGQYWPKVYPRLQPIVNRVWKAQVHEANRRAESDDPGSTLGIREESPIVPTSQTRRMAASGDYSLFDESM